jgi:hypothetical protein
MEGFDLGLAERVVKALQKVQVFLLGFLSPDSERQALLGAQLRPRDEDWETVFVTEAAPFFQIYYEGLFALNMSPSAQPSQTEVRCSVALAEQLVTKNRASAKFPGGYQKIAQLFQPNTIWISWKFTEPEKAIGMAYDGLVSLPDERFLWFSKRWRVL